MLISPGWSGPPKPGRHSAVWNEKYKILVGRKKRSREAWRAPERKRQRAGGEAV